MLIFMPHFSSINFYQNRPKFKLFLPKKYEIFERWGLRPHIPVPQFAGGFAPRPPKQSQSANYWLNAPENRYVKRSQVFSRFCTD